MTDIPIPFNRPFLTGQELPSISDAAARAHLSGDGHYTRLCSGWLERTTGSRRCLLTHSCTASLEMAAMLCDVQRGDEVVMPSFTFVSTANAFALRGATPVFVDIQPDTLNLDCSLIEQAITQRTKAIVPVHYAGVGCDMDRIMEIARRHRVRVVEDAAQGCMAHHKGRALGSIGDLGALSFHETKNITCGEGGALLVNDTSLISKAEIIREKGTNRSRFFRGEVDKYTWVGLGSSYLLGEISAAFLMGQISEASSITQKRLSIWNTYHQALSVLDGAITRPTIPEHCQHNAHMYWMLLPSAGARDRFIRLMRDRSIHCTFHYQPLHLSDIGSSYGRVAGSLAVTESIADRIVRLPLWIGIEPYMDRIISAILSCVPSAGS